MKKINFLDLKAQYPYTKGDVLDGFQKIFNNTQFTLGEAVTLFEKQYASYNNISHCVAVNSGTAALHIALLTVGVGPGDEVIIPANTFIATAEAVSLCGATPVLVDVEKDTYNINTSLLINAITPKTKAIVPVHLYGQMADMEHIMGIAKEYGLKVVEDACQAHGASQNGKMAGTIGDIGCFSFYPGKNLGSYGEGGACITNNPEYEEKLRMLRDHGSKKKYHHDIKGFNYRMTGFQGVVLSTKLKMLNSWNAMRQKNAQVYNDTLFNVVTPKTKEGNEHVYHLYVIQTQDRARDMKKLEDAGIGCGIHYPIPIHLQKAYEDLGYKDGDFPVTEFLAGKILSLPMYPELEHTDIIRICKVLQ